MLGLIAMLDLTSFWSIAWVFRDSIPPTLLTPGDRPARFRDLSFRGLAGRFARGGVGGGAIITFIRVLPVVDILVGVMFFVPMTVAIASGAAQ